MRLTALASVACVGLSLVASAAERKTVHAAWFEKKITCQMGSLLAGYGPEDRSTAILDDLLLSGLCLDDGRKRTLLMSFDLIGMDADLIRELRGESAAILGVPEAQVMLTCTHTHGGPHTRRHSGGKRDEAYVTELKRIVFAAVRELKEKGVTRECLVGFFSSACDENRNRRYTIPENCASFNAHRRALHKLTTGIADKELGTIALLDPTTYAPLYVIGNYAAHPLASHAPGLGGVRITSDYPGFYRRYVAAETGATAMFVSGACGDLVPKDDELGVNAARRVGENLAMASVAALIDIQRNASRFVISEPRLGARLVTQESRLRAPYRKRYGRETEKLEVQCLSVGDVAFVGVPGELVNELGLEIKWHSPFCRTFIAYSATDYFGYISTLNQVAAGGYEPQDQRFASRDTLKLVMTARDALLALREQVYPEGNSAVDPYPDNLALPLVSLPGGYKASKWQRDAK